MKKIICLILALLMTAAALASCAKDSGAGEESTSPVTEQPAVSEEESGTVTEAPNASEQPTTLDIVVDGVAKYYVYCDKGSEHGSTVQYIIDDLIRKTGVALTATTTKKENTDLHMIYVGADYDKLFPDAETKLTFRGYAAVLHEGNIYLCASSADLVKKAASKLLSSIPVKECVTQNADGEKTLIIPTSLMFVYNPGYTVTNPKLLATHVSKYSIVYAENGRYTDQLLAYQLADEIGVLTGFAPRVMSDKMAPADHEILIGNTSRKTLPTIDSYTYTVTAEGNKVCMNFGSAMAFDGIIKSLREIFGTEALNVSGKIDDRIKIQKDATDIRVMTSNVLFSNASNAERPWKERAALLSDLYLDFKPDFIGLQEASGMIGDAIRDALKDEYTMISQSNNRHTPILYRKDLWRVATDGSGQEIKKMQMFAGNHCWAYEWVMFESIADPSVQVLVMNLHFHPGGEAYRGPRPDDMDAFNAEVRRLEDMYPTIPMFITGDYNTRVTSGRTDLDEGWAEDVIVGTKIQCGAQLTDDSDDKAGSTIDHICTNDELVDVIRHRGVSYTAMKQSSDHIPYFIDVRIKTN